MTRILFLILALCGPSLAGAQDRPTLSQVVQTIDGQEVRIRGTLGQNGFGQDAGFRDVDGGYYTATFALDRAGLAQVEGCSIRDPRDACTVDASAEIKLDGGSIRLTIFELHTVTRAKP